MFWRLSYRAAPILFLVLSTLWTVGTYSPFFYSLAFPNQEIQRLVGALESRESPRPELSVLAQNVFTSSGKLKRAIRVAAYYGASAEYKVKQSHTSKQTEFAYLAWFERRSNPTILVVNLTEIDGTILKFSIREGDPIALARILLLPVIALAFSLYWFRRSSKHHRKEPAA
jgi:hypothetical protein